MRCFKYTVKESIIRSMNRKQYKTLLHYLRFAAWKVHQGAYWDLINKNIVNLVNSGCINSENLIKES